MVQVIRRCRSRAWNTFPIVSKSAIPLKPSTVQAPGRLAILQTRPPLYWSGSAPVAQTLKKRACDRLEVFCIESFTSSACRPSMPGAFPFLASPSTELFQFKSRRKGGQVSWQGGFKELILLPSKAITQQGWVALSRACFESTVMICKLSRIRSDAFEAATSLLLLLW